MMLPNGDIRPIRTSGRRQSDKNRHSYRITAKLALGLQLNTNLCNTGANTNLEGSLAFDPLWPYLVGSVVSVSYFEEGYVNWASAGVQTLKYSSKL
ncbi:hypothetical protein AVEN_107148-1 [Araneus ventricosus]|uniref:Uncharacterized protein n=1 Tax=Araneus ventricosus TaxID=182803 RepID=A0A4Y2I4L8_ARAVE|nr:hypothetical protein AVEN_107148-1 [Araneus ventricosus]